MKNFLKLGFYVGHPIWIPLWASVFYFLYSPVIIDRPVLKAKVFGITVLTIFIPVLIILLLKNLKVAQSIALQTITSRRYFIFGLCIILFSLLRYILNAHYPELFYFFLGYLLSLATALLLTFYQYKVSLHVLALSALLSFVIGMTLFYTLQIVPIIALIVFVLGWVAGSRTKNRNMDQIIWGLVIGSVPQIIFITAVLLHI